MELFGYIASAFIGLSLGLIGGGGSILTVPVLVYLFGISPLLATSYSLFIVGSTSLIGAVNNLRKGEVSLKAAFLFGTTSIITVFATRRFLIPEIPRELWTISGTTITEPFVTMVLFGVLMLLASFSMIRNKNDDAARMAGCTEYGKFFKLLGYGISIGLVTGLLGAGGGFLLIPALVLFIGLPMKKAVGTSLLIIALNSLFGFLADLGHFQIDWGFLLLIALIATAGVLIGGRVARVIPSAKLKTGFGWFILVMGIYIILKEFLG
ncbi:MAG TPA: sulfite exporter TauE/SafE family protein [Sphingobacteriaceae bacterium]